MDGTRWLWLYLLEKLSVHKTRKFSYLFVTLAPVPYEVFAVFQLADFIFLEKF